MDATIIEAPPSTKNENKQRDPEMKQTRKGKNWHFGLKLHTGTDRRGIVHSISVTHAAASDLGELPGLLHGDEREIYGDQAYYRRGRSAKGIRDQQLCATSRIEGDLLCLSRVLMKANATRSFLWIPRSHHSQIVPLRHVQRLASSVLLVEGALNDNRSVALTP